MKVVCISDTHNHLQGITIPEGDLLIHSGDATMNGGIKEVSLFAKSMAKLPHKKKIFVPGNHDALFDTDLALAKSIMKDYTPETEVLINEEYTYDNVRFFGSPVNSNIPGWAFYMSKSEAKSVYKSIPKCDVLITHEPPFGILDKINDTAGFEPTENNHIGNNALSNHVLFHLAPKAHIFGHIHESYGEASVRGIKFLNASLLNEHYEIQNHPIVFEL